MKRSFCPNFFVDTSLKPNVFICLIPCLYCLFSRSLCTVVCKWTYTSDGGWDDSFWKIIGLEDLVKDKYEKIGISGGCFVLYLYMKSYIHVYIKDLYVYIKKIYTYKKMFCCIIMNVSRNVAGLDEASDRLVTRLGAFPKYTFYLVLSSKTV